MTKKTALVCGAGGFIGNHMVNRLQDEGYWVRGVDLNFPAFGESRADHFVLRDLRSARDVEDLVGYAGCNRNPGQLFDRQFNKPFDEIYQFAADMGGAGYVFTGVHDADIMHNSATINLNVLDAVVKQNKECRMNKTKIFYSSSACIYPWTNQTDPDNPNCKEDTAYPANPDSEYGWEKLFSERMYLAYNRCYNIPVRIARYHNIFGPLGTWTGGKEKAPAAICRKVAEASMKPGNPPTVDIWGDGEQTRSFLYIDDCIDATRALMDSKNITTVLNIGSEEMVSINTLLEMVCEIANEIVKVNYIDGPQGVRGRNSDNKLIEELLGWKPKHSLKDGLEKTYPWIKEQLSKTI